MFLRSSKLLQNLVWSFLPFIGQYLCCFACGAGSCGCSFPRNHPGRPPPCGLQWDGESLRWVPTPCTPSGML